MENITFERFITKEEIIESFRKIIFRGLYDENGDNLKPYMNAKFSLVTIHPPERPTSSPQIMHDFRPQPLFTAQPTIYGNQIKMLSQVNEFLETIDKKIYNFRFEGVQYNWEGRGRFHVLPPIIEKHHYPLKKGSFDLKKMAAMFNGAYVKDAKGKLHPLSTGLIRKFFVDEESKIEYLNVFNHNAELINYGLRFNGDHEFYIICDGSHRIDYALEHLNKPINVILVESDHLFPYYAFPMPFRPSTRLTSKKAEKMYPRLERDKVHLLNDFIKKVLHYDWEAGGLHVSELRNKKALLG